MKLALFASAARDELHAAAEWYERHALGLGAAFVDCVDDAVLRVRKTPDAFPEWDEDPRFRKVLVQRFPYILFYRELPTEIQIIAVAHGAREPGYWTRRR